MKPKSVDKMLVEPPPPPAAIKLTLKINPTDGGRCGLEILVDNVTLSDVVKQREAAAAALALQIVADEAVYSERLKVKSAEANKRQRAREAMEASEASLGEQRCGSGRRKQ